VEKIPSFKYIVQAIQIFQDNAVINLIALRVGEIRGIYITIINRLFYFLINQDWEQCHHDKKIYNENETWSIDHCTTCTCRAGRVHCSMVHCPTSTHCGYMYKPDNECCPKCGG